MEPGPVERRYAFVFVFQQGMLEAAALLLVASLKRFLRCEHELVAAVPTPSELWGEPTETGMGLLQEMGVRVETFTNEFGRDRPNANKTYCLQVPTDADKLVLLDSDILCLREFAGGERFRIPLNLAPAYAQSIDSWDEYYRAVGVPMPSTRLPTLLTKEHSLPWFNSGIVAVDTGIPFGEVWLDCERTLVADDSVTVGPRQLQISLALAVHRLGIPYDCLDERFNYPVFGKRIDAEEPPFFAHYGHWGGPIVQHEPVLEATVASLVHERPALLDVMRTDSHWSGLARHLEQRGKGAVRGRTTVGSGEKEPPADVVITGIAGSGVGYLADLLDGYGNCVVIKDPRGRVENALRVPVPWPLAIFYTLERMRILGSDGLIPPEGVDGTQGSETADVTVENEDFVLATASTHRYLARLDGLRRTLPHARLVVCVRDPFDTIASWKRFFETHPAGELDQAMVPKPGDPWLTQTQRDSVSLLDAAPPAHKRAMVWQHFAELILNERDRVTLVRFDDLVSSPEQVVGEVFQGLNVGRRESEIDPPSRADRSILDSEDEQAIRAICSQAAFELGFG